MTQRTCRKPETARPHVAVIMDGNGRWAESRGLPRAAGHAAGARVVRRVVAAAAEAGVGILTLYAFSADNWKRPEAEVKAIMGLLGRTLAEEQPRLVEQDVRLSVIGRRDRLSPGLVEAIARAEAATAAGARLHLRVAVDYSARQAIRDAARLAGQSLLADAPDVDLLIRTGGERRLSDFLLWECAYAELHFTPVRWPDFGPQDLLAALEDFAARDRRFGGLGQVSAWRA